MNFNFLDEGCILYTLIFFLTFFLTIFVNGKKPRIVCFYLIVILEVLLGGLRGMHVGADTYTYSQVIIPSLQNYTYKEILQGPTVLISRDPVCYCFLKFISTPFTTFTPYFIILQVVFWTLIANTILRFSHDPLLTLFIFIAFRFPFFNMSGIRQGLALAITTFSYRFFQSNKKIVFVCTVVIAALFHRSAISFLMLLFIHRLNLAKRPWVLYMGVFMLLFLSYVMVEYEGLQGIAESDFMYSNYLRGGTEGGNYFSILFLIIVFSMVNVFLRNSNHMSENNIIYNICGYALLLSVLGLFVSLFFRLTMYIGFLIPILYSNALTNVSNTKKRKELSLAYSAVICFIYMCTGVVEAYVPYEFYWENTEIV